MIIKKLDTAVYSIGKRLQGYHLLRNPEGTPFTTVRFIKYSENINPKTLDVEQFYEKITRQTSGFEDKETTEFLEVTNYAFYNDKTNTIDNKKQKIYERYNSKKFFTPEIYLEKGYIPAHKLDKRDVSPLNNVIRIQLQSNRNSPLRYLGFTPKSIVTKKTLAQTVLENYNKHKLDKELTTPPKQNFWKTLWHNLNSKTPKNS